MDGLACVIFDRKYTAYIAVNCSIYRIKESFEVEGQPPACLPPNGGDDLMNNLYLCCVPVGADTLHKQLGLLFRAHKSKGAQTAFDYQRLSWSLQSLYMCHCLVL